ncbi:MAG: efflux RND transporter permease subunit, partial [Polymorphobacter sp.]
MNFIDFAVRRWQITLVLFALFAAVGLSAFLTIPRSVDPHFPSPFVVIVATQPGADPAEMEQTIAKPIEDVLQGLDNIVRTASRSTDGTAVITAEFSWSGDPEKDYDQLVRDVSAIRGQLPATLQRLEFRKTRTTETSVVQFALVSETASFRRLEKIAKTFREQLNQVPGVRGSRTWGVPTPEVRVAIDAGRM